MAPDEKQIAVLIEKLGIPFARALGEFVRTVSANADRQDTDPATTIPENGSQIRFGGFTLYAAKTETTANAAGSRSAKSPPPAGRIKFVEFNPAVPAKKAGNRLQSLFKQRRISQIDIARKLKIAPSVVSRVLKRPERSRLQTIRKIADAAGIPLSELI